MTIPNSVTSIGDDTFYGCSGLTSVSIPNSVKTIGDGAFEGCSSLTSVTIPNSVTSIGGNAFAYCRGLTSLTIGNSVTSIGDGAFYVCSGLTSVTIPNSVTSVGVASFDDCSSLTSVTWNAKDCNNFTSSTSPFGGVKSNINSFTFGNDVKRIPAYICNGFTGLTSVTIPNSVTSIGDWAFNGCSGLKSVIINDLTAWCNIGFKTSNSNPLYYAHNLYLGSSKVTDLVIPNSVKRIGSEAFYGCTGLTSVTIPNSVTAISHNAFYGCSGLTSVTIGNSVTSIEINAFSGCSSLKSVTIPNSVTSISSNAFGGCSGLKSVTIGNSVTSIGSGAFSGCSGLTSVTIPNSVTSIGGRAFWGCSRLTSVTWNAKNITDFTSSTSPFGGVKYKINSFTFGNEVERIPAYICNGFTDLTSVTIPNSVTSIGSCAFLGCSGLTSVTIGNSVTSIGDWAFYGCRGIIDVTWNAVNCNDFSPLNHAPFYELNTIQSVTFGNEVQHIPVFLCYGLTDLKQVVVGESIQSIGDYAFANSSSIEDFVMLRADPIAINANVFEGVPKASCDLHVKVGSKARYEAADVWKDFFYIIEDAEDFSGVETINTVDSKAPIVSVKYINLAGVESDIPFNGLNIVITTRTDGTHTVTKVLK